MHPLKGIFPFEGISKAESYCRVDVYPTPEPVVIITELEANQGTSAINCIKEVTSGIVKKYKLDPKTTTFISHCPEGQSAFGGEDFHYVPVEWDGQSYEMTRASAWDAVSRKEVEGMIGSRF
jgi:hypothetical protein